VSAGAGAWVLLGPRSENEALYDSAGAGLVRAMSDGAMAIISTFREFSKLCRQENFRPPASVWEFPA
jgi:hypothetical protein